MRDQQVAPYGSWRSPITAEMLAEDSIGLGEVMLTVTPFIGWRRARLRKDVLSSCAGQRRRVRRM